MKISVQSIHFDADRKLLAFIEKKVNKLDQFFGGIIQGEVYLRLQKTENEANKMAVIKVKVPGNSLLVKQQCKSFEEATDKAVDSLLKQVDRHKTKLQNRLKDQKQRFAN